MAITIRGLGRVPALFRQYQARGALVLDRKGRRPSQSRIRGRAGAKRPAHDQSSQLLRRSSSPNKIRSKTEDEQVQEHEEAFLAEGQTVMVVASESVPEIVRLISKKGPA
ncbi:MAG: hypothetical protein ACLQIB_12550 [Isosphaeraceae bacterium]